MLSEASIIARFTDYAADCGGPVTGLEYVRGTLGPMNDLARRSGTGDATATTPTVMIQATGRFRRRRRGLAPPGVIPHETGMAFRILINERTERGIDAGIRPRPLDLSSLGTVVHLPVPAGMEGVLPSESDIVSMIMEFAAHCGDPAPSAIRYVYGSRADLNGIVSGALLQGSDGAIPAVLVEATGHFTWRHSAPHGASPFTSGTAITLVINELTGAAVDRGISPEPRDWSPFRDIHTTRPYPNSPPSQHAF